MNATLPYPAAFFFFFLKIQLETTHIGLVFFYAWARPFFLKYIVPRIVVWVPPKCRTDIRWFCCTILSLFCYNNDLLSCCHGILMV